MTATMPGALQALQRELNEIFAKCVSQITKGATMKPKTKTVRVKRESILRRYTYTAHLDAKTGRVLAITAGCRRWRGFTAAAAHYYPSRQDAGTRWSNNWVNALLEIIPGVRDERMMFRAEARAILVKLQADVRDRQRKIKAAKKRKVRR